MPHPVELSGGGFIGVSVEQLVERGDRLGSSLADLCNRSRQVERFKGQGPASAHAQLDRHLVAIPGQRRVLDQVSQQPLAVGVPGFGSVPYLLEVACQLPDAFDLALGEFAIADLGADLSFPAGLLRSRSRSFQSASSAAATSRLAGSTSKNLRRARSAS